MIELRWRLFGLLVRLSRWRLRRYYEGYDAGTRAHRAEILAFREAMLAYRHLTPGERDQLPGEFGEAVRRADNVLEQALLDCYLRA